MLEFLGVNRHTQLSFPFRQGSLGFGQTTKSIKQLKDEKCFKIRKWLKLYQLAAAPNLTLFFIGEL